MKGYVMTILLILLFTATFLAVVVSNNYWYYCTAIFWLTLYALYMTSVLTDSRLMVITMLLFIALTTVFVLIAYIYEKRKNYETNI